MHYYPLYRLRLSTHRKVYLKSCTCTDTNRWLVSVTIRAALRHYQAVSSQILKAELLTQAGPLLMIVAYAPMDQSSMEDKDQFYLDLDCVMTTAN